MMRLFVLLLLTISSLFADPTLSWISNFDEAQKEAESKKKPLLIFFSGSDWCSECALFQEHVLNNPLFVKEVRSQFIFAVVDFPLHRALPSAQAQKNNELQEKFKIVGFPTLALQLPSGNVILMAVSSGIPAKRFGELLVGETRAVTILETVMFSFKGERYTDEQLIDLYETAKLISRDDWQAKILEAGLKKEKSNGYFLREQYRMLIQNGKRNTLEAEGIRKILLESDPDNELGYQLYVAVSDFEASLREQKDASKPLIDFLSHFSASKQSWRVKTMLASYLMVAKRYNEAKQYLLEALEEAPKEKQEAINFALSKLP